MSEREKLVEVMARAINVSAGDNSHWTFWEDESRAALAALESAGVRLVPVEATMEMAHSVSVKDIPLRDVNGWYEDLDIQEGARVIYRAMLAASPYAKESSNG